MNEYSTTISYDGVSDGRCVNQMIKGVIEQLEYFRKCADNPDELDASDITVYLAGTDDLVAYKESYETLDEFLGQLRIESRVLGE